MVLEVIYVVRHGHRMSWTLDHRTGEYRSAVRTPTGIPSDPALASHGVEQSKELAEHVATLDPPVDAIYCSPYYRCLQTLKPTAEKLFPQGKAGGKIRVENGLGEFHGLAPFTHPSPAPLSLLQTLIPTPLDPTSTPIITPSAHGETIPGLHDRIAYTLHRLIAALDAHPAQPRAVLLCTHAASMITIGRALTGDMPADADEEDFKCFTCSMSTFRRRSAPAAASALENQEAVEAVQEWRSGSKTVPRIKWRGKGVQGGWICERNGDASFLSAGEERGWRFSGDEAFMLDPNAQYDNGGGGALGSTEQGKTSRL